MADAGKRKGGGKRRHDPRYAAPTDSELATLAGGASAAAGDLVSLQVSEMASSARVKYGSRTKALEEALFALRSALLAAAAKHVTAATVAASRVGRGVLPLSGAHFAEVELDFAPPARVDVVGSFLLRTVAKTPRGAGGSGAGASSGMNVDVACEMPASCLGKKDELNRQYADKRALYVAALAEAVAADAACRAAFDDIALV
eukprot:CAMPEP_0203828364 /NCGR_PEP_ID=MMETSP0115-20131106/61041_1 /ASSEMBLY_ACC=CAM_ASM_000227 /TAXON_ID=33651 /ORGANISM="Bicosoecid sp, Strain ms1" /LENGTH=201 /DNA_ID=CAMNT_0050737423 /DNA_START=134 /DNA_END=735 /DNA_ORIENTATION=-